MNTTLEKYKLFATADVKSILSGGVVIRTPTGLEAFRTELCNLAIIKPGKELPCSAWMTGYGCSYLSKVHTGTPRAKEFMVNVFAGSDQGWMLQMSIAGADNDTVLYRDTVKQIVSRAVLSLPKAYQKRFVGKRIHMEFGTMSDNIGFVFGTKDKEVA